MVATVRVDRRATAAADLFVFSTAPAARPVLLMVDDGPVAAGAITLEPGAPRATGPAVLDGKLPLDAGTLERVEC